MREGDSNNTWTQYTVSEGGGTTRGHSTQLVREEDSNNTWTQYTVSEGGGTTRGHSTQLVREEGQHVDTVHS